MATFPLTIVCPDGVKFEGQIQQLTVRTTSGEMGILAGHINCVCPLGMGRATILTEGERKYAACIGGMVSVVDGKVSLVPTSFEWAEDIDVARAQASYDRGRGILNSKGVSDKDVQLAQARIKRALVRKSVAQGK